jgi:hypothetical protein
MKILAVLILIAGFMAAFIPVETTYSDEVVVSESVTVTGVLVDSKCYGEMPSMNKGNEHVVMMDGNQMKMPNCATACANMGIPAAIATKDGNTVTVIAPAGQLAEHMEKEIRIQGRMAYDGGLLPDKVEVREGDQWKEVKLVFMM